MIQQVDPRSAGITGLSRPPALRAYADAPDPTSRAGSCLPLRHR
jgi:hypothetical protein